MFIMSYDENQFPERERVSPTDVTVPNESIRISHTVRAAPPWPPEPQAFRRRETFSPGMTIFLIVLAIVSSQLNSTSPPGNTNSKPGNRQRVRNSQQQNLCHCYCPGGRYRYSDCYSS